MRSSLFILLFFLGAVLPANVYSEEESDGALQVTNLGNITIESESGELRFKEKTVVFSKNVTAQIEEKDLTIKCDKMRVYYNESENGDVNYDRILATGNVKITRTDGSSGTAEEAVYDFAEEIITMTGQPVFKQGKNTLKGSNLTYNLKEESITVTDVKAVLHQESEGSISTGGQ